MNIQKYLAFINTVDCNSFTKAANVLNYSQSGISRMIADLEEEWNIPLLERDRLGVHLTSDGAVLIPFVRKICEDYRSLQSQVDSLNGLESGLIRIGTFSSVATHWLPNIIKHFQNDYPHVEYELLLGDYTEIESWIIDGRVDCGFITVPTIHKMETFILEKDDLLVILPQNHPLANCEKFPVESLCDYPFMLLEKGAKAEISAIFEQNKIAPDVHFTTWDDYAIMSMVESGLGISILPKLILKRIPYNILVKELNVPAYRNIAFALRDSKTASTVTKKFMEYLQYR